MEDLNESFDSSASFEFPDLIIDDDQRYYRRFLFTAQSDKDIKLYFLKHPKTNTDALFEITEDGLNEVFKISSEGRSVIYGESVIKKSDFYVFSPLHPLFLLVPELIEKKPKSLLLDDIFTDKLTLVAHITSALKGLNLAMNVTGMLCLLLKSYLDLTYGLDFPVEDGMNRYTYDHERLVTWLIKRFQIFLNAVREHNQAPAMFTEYESSLRYYTFEIFSDYLPESLTAEMRCVLEIEKPDLVVNTPTPVPAKRKINTPTSEKRPAPLNAKQRKLKEASKGVQSLNMFFKKAP